MKILQILPELNEGGVERGVVELNREFVKRKINSNIISHGGKLVENITNDGGVHYKFDVCSKNILTFFWRVFRLKKLLKSINPDIIHVRSRLPAWLVFFANKGLNFKVVSTVHGLNSVNFYSKIMTRADKIICVGEAVKEHIVKNYELKNKDIVVIQRGVNLDKFNTKILDKNFIDEFKIKFDLNDKFIVTSVGRITELKDYESFIKSIKIAQKEIPNIVGLIVGGARENKIAYLNSLKKLCSDIQIEQNIKFVSSQSKMPEIYYLSDILVNASLKMGNVARTITEALAMDTPVIATTYKGLENIIKEGQNGAVVNVKDEFMLSEKIIKLKKLELKNVASSIPLDFTLAKMAENTILAYESVLEKS